MVSIRRKKNVMKNFRMYAKLAQKKPTSHIFITFLFSAVLLWHICNGTVPTQNRNEPFSSRSVELCACLILTTHDM